MLVKFQGLTYPRFDLLEQDSKLSEDVLLDPDLWKNFIVSVLPNLEGQLVGAYHHSNVMIFSAKSGKLLLWAEYDARQ
jgi:hypothetical protein